MYIRKTYDEYEIQGDYDFNGNWEAVCTESTYREAKTQLRCYNENEFTYPHRIVKKRIRKELKQ